MSSQSQLASGLKSLTTGWESMSLPCYRASWAARPLPSTRVTGSVADAGAAMSPTDRR